MRNKSCVVSRSNGAFVFKIRFLRSGNARSPKSHQVIGIRFAPLVEYQHCIGKPLRIICCNFIFITLPEGIHLAMYNEALTIDYTACNARATTTEWSRLIGIVIAALMDYKRTRFDIAYFQSWR